MHQQPAAVFRMAYDAGAAALDAESAKAPDFTSDRLRTDRAIVSSTAFNACSACREVTSFPSSRWSSLINCVLFIGLPA